MNDKNDSDEFNRYLLSLLWPFTYNLNLPKKSNNSIYRVNILLEFGVSHFIIIYIQYIKGLKIELFYVKRTKSTKSFHISQ